MEEDGEGRGEEGVGGEGRGGEGELHRGCVEIRLTFKLIQF